MGIVGEKIFSYRGVPQDLVLGLAKEFGLNCFIETGTYSGQTALWASNHFSKVVTFEALEELYAVF